MNKDSSNQEQKTSVGSRLGFQKRRRNARSSNGFQQFRQETNPVSKKDTDYQSCGKLHQEHAYFARNRQLVAASKLGVSQVTSVELRIS